MPSSAPAVSASRAAGLSVMASADPAAIGGKPRRQLRGTLVLIDPAGAGGQIALQPIDRRPVQAGKERRTVGGHMLPPGDEEALRVAAGIEPVVDPGVAPRDDEADPPVAIDRRLRGAQARLDAVI